MSEPANEQKPQQVKMSMELVRQLQPALKELGHDLPDAARLVPSVNLDLTVSELGLQLGGLLKNEGIFRMGDSRDLVTVDESTARIIPMSPERFCSWVEKTVTTYKPKQGYSKDTTMGKDLAGKILNSDFFLAQLHQLHGVAPVRMPARRGPREIELLPAGFDQATGVYCADRVDYDLEMTVEAAREVFEELLREFAFEGQRGQIWSTRSSLVQVAAMLSTYCRYLWPAGTTRPAIIWTANQAGAGKSLLAYMILAFVYGDPGNAAVPPKEEEMIKLLDAVAQRRAPYLWLDDAPPAIFSKALNKFILAPKHEGRVLGTPLTFEEPACTQVLVTGNALIIERDLERRALICELFEAGEIEDKKFDFELSPQRLSGTELRARVLAACWAIVREWSVNECHQSTRRKPSFEAWSSDVVGMLECLGVEGDVLGRPELAMGGDEESQQWRELIIAIASEIDEDPEEEPEIITMDDVIDKARQMELLCELVGSEGGKPVTDDRRRKLGRRLQRWRGRQLRDLRGRLFTFGQRRSNRQRGIVVTFEA